MKIERPRNRTLLQSWILSILIWMSKLLWNVKAKGIENIPAAGPFILCPNHESHMDSFWIVWFIDKKIRDRMCIIGKKQHFEFLLSLVFCKLLGGIPVDREGDPLPVLMTAEKALEDRRMVVIHPEGTRTRSGKLGPFRDGAAWLSLKTKVPVLPAAISGAYDIYPYNKHLPKIFHWKKCRRPELEVKFGGLIHPPKGSEHDASAVKEMTGHIRAAVLGLQSQGDKIE